MRIISNVEFRQLGHIKILNSHRSSDTINSPLAYKWMRTALIALAASTIRVCTAPLPNCAIDKLQDNSTTAKISITNINVSVPASLYYQHILMTLYHLDTSYTHDLVFRSINYYRLVCITLNLTL